MSNARLREVLNAGNTAKEKGPPVADGVLSPTPDTPEAVELRSRRSAIDCVATSSSYLEEDSDGPLPHELYGKFTWKIENFSETSKRELRSTVFEVGSYKWYILVYPQGCDVCNHLSLFLCVADYDKLLPGWSHFAQFTIAVVNKDPKKSKYSDTLHRFCKKEHDWGWKKFMELSKVLDGFTVSDTLVIKAQVQVIRDRVDRPFRCLDPQYRRELVRVYLTNVEGICRRFVEERRERMVWVKEDPGAFQRFWRALDDDIKKEAVQELEEIVLKGVVKRFFNEKEVTSTLVMDALFCGCRQLEENTRLWFEGKIATADPPNVIVDGQQGVFFLGGDILQVLENAANEIIPICGRDEKAADGSAMRSGQEDESVKDTIERDELRLAELGRRTVEMYAISHIFAEHLEVAYREAESLKRQEALIREEEEAERLEEYRLQIKAQAERERRMKKKEKKRARKEAERVRREAEESEKQRMEDIKREEEDRKRREAEEKRRMLEEELERQHQKALEEAAVRSREADRRRQKEQEAEASTSTACQEQPTTSEAQTEPALERQSMRKAEERPPTKEPLSSRPSSSQSSSENVRKPLDPLPRINGTIPQRPTEPIQSPSSLTPCAGTRSPPVANGISHAPTSVATLRARIKELEKLLGERDLEVTKLKAQVAEYRARELEHKAQTSGAMRELPGLTPRITQVSHASQTQGNALATAPAAGTLVADAEAPSTTTSSRPSSRASSTEMNHLHRAAQPGVQQQTVAAGTTTVGLANPAAPAPQVSNASSNIGDKSRSVPSVAGSTASPAALPAVPSSASRGPDQPRPKEPAPGKAPVATQQDLSQSSTKSGGPDSSRTTQDTPRSTGSSMGSGTAPSQRAVGSAGAATPGLPGGQQGNGPKSQGSPVAAASSATASYQYASLGMATGGHGVQQDLAMSPAQQAARSAAHGGRPEGMLGTPYGAPGPSPGPTSSLMPVGGGQPVASPFMSRNAPFGPHPQPQGHGYASMQSHPHVGVHQGPMGHQGQQHGIAQQQVGVSGPLGVSCSPSLMPLQKPPPMAHGMHPHGAQGVHMNHQGPVHSQNAESRRMAGDSSGRMPNGFRPFMAGNYGSMGGPGAQGAHSQPLVGRAHSAHESVLGSIADSIHGPGLKSSDMGYMASSHYMMHQRPPMNFSSPVTPKQHSDPGAQGSETPLDDFAHMGLIQDLLE
ncbi:unnamed protein product [Ostreobium quekettii]|uniref:MATH domain-containing protein n=1 Tax=Ostreobium quekettii TaxID=121088 RepID=A0A8S1IN47_9CHLO|nr:unnamed protein product [Ostreobium quekettii]